MKYYCFYCHAPFWDNGGYCPSCDDEGEEYDDQKETFRSVTYIDRGRE